MKSNLFTSLAALALFAATTVFADDAHMSTRFSGAKANTGTVTHSVQSGKNILAPTFSLSVPNLPALLAAVSLRASVTEKRSGRSLSTPAHG